MGAIGRSKTSKYYGPHQIIIGQAMLKYVSLFYHKSMAKSSILV